MIRIGIDVGGTGLKAGAVNEKGLILSKVSCPTRAERPYQAVIQDMAGLARSAAVQAGCDWDKVASVGAGIPGVENAATGIVPFCTNLGWHQVPLRDTLSELLQKGVRVGNDATVAALAEHVAGAAAGTQSSVLVTLGTGVGGGVILDGRPFVGCHGVATEIGHLIVQMDGILCSCGNRGCWERYASATALIREGRELARKQPEGMIARQGEGDLEAITAKVVIDCAKAGDPGAVALFEQYAYWVAVGLANLINAYDPEVILLGGGVSAAGDFLLEAVRARLPELVFFKTMPYARVELARLGNDAGIIGAAMLY